MPGRRRRATTRTCARRSAAGATSSTTTTNGSGWSSSSGTSGPVTRPRWRGPGRSSIWSCYGWDTDPTHPCPGGVFWTQAPWSQDRNTVSNGPGAELGLQLYAAHRRDTKSYLTWAKRMYDWAQRLPARAERAVLGPHRPRRHDREDPVELQPGRHARRQAFCFYRATGDRHVPERTPRPSPTRRSRSTARTAGC